MKKFQLPLPRMDRSVAHDISLFGMEIGWETGYIDERSIWNALVLSDRMEDLLPQLSQKFPRITGGFLP